MNASFRIPARELMYGLITFLVTALPVPATAATHFHSGPEQVSVLELFTSQGCNSCPPADEWVSELSDHQRLWVDFIPVAFHVDYWDQLGWKDRFAQPDFSARQWRYQDEGGIYTVYTPGLVVNGLEWRRWRDASEPEKSDVHVGNLDADIDAKGASIRFSPRVAGGDELVASVAILGFGLESRIGAGENNGRTLVNDFVVLGLEQLPMTRVNRSYSAKLELPPISHEAEQYAVVVWVSTRENQAPIQATGGWYHR